MIRRNIKIEIAMAQYGMKNYDVAKLLNVSESTWCRKKRVELPIEEQEKIIDLIMKAGDENE